MPRTKGKGEYPDNWGEISYQVKYENGFKCERCGHPDDKETGHLLTVHHLDGNKSNNERWNLASLCQKCHLRVQNKVFLPQFFMFEHSDWFKPHVEGYYRAMGLEIKFEKGVSVISSSTLSPFPSEAEKHPAP